MLRIDKELDTGWGACWLGKPEIANLVQDALLYFDGDRYRLLSWCLMPNHVHAIVHLTNDHRLGDIVKSWKTFTGRRANALIEQSGSFWHKDYFDRYIRDEGHLNRKIAYVEQNPVKAGLVGSPSDWPWSSARLRMSEPGGSRSDGDML